MEQEGWLDGFCDGFRDIVVDIFPDIFPASTDFDALSNALFNAFSDVIGVLSLILEGEELNGAVVLCLSGDRSLLKLWC